MTVQAYGESPLNAEAYDGLFRQVGDKLRSAPGFIAHLAGPTAGGWGITEIWESRAAADALRGALAGRHAWRQLRRRRIFGLDQLAAVHRRHGAARIPRR